MNDIFLYRSHNKLSCIKCENTKNGSSQHLNLHEMILIFPTLASSEIISLARKIAASWKISSFSIDTNGPTKLRQSSYCFRLNKHCAASNMTDKRDIISAFFPNRFESAFASFGIKQSQMRFVISTDNKPFCSKAAKHRRGSPNEK